LDSTLGLDAPASLRPFTIAVNLTIAVILAAVLAWIYRRYGRSLTNRALLAGNFVMITLTTTLIISIVKSSLALSLGLVGALSIVRFRAAIKEPEELAYLFLCIAVGLGLGADQRQITVLAFSFIAVVIVLASLLQHRKEAQNLFLNFETEQDAGQDALRKVLDVLKAQTRAVDLRRVDTKNNSLQASFLISVPEPSALERIISDLKKLRPDASVTFVEQTRQFDI
jgi:uncharacterized membrane protein YhiD involved in acid resistance